MSTFTDRMVDQILEDAKRGELWFYNGLDEDMGLYLVHALRHMSRDANCSSIHININSNGGATKYTFPIIDLIESIDQEVVCTVDHMACSSAALILSCGNQRKALENAVIMIHGIGYGTGSSKQKIPFHESYLDIVKKKEKKMCSILAQKTKKPYNYWEKIVNQSEDRWFDAEEALEVGLIDEII